MGSSDGNKSAADEERKAIFVAEEFVKRPVDG